MTKHSLLNRITFPPALSAMVLVVFFMITGCASDHDLQRDGLNLFGGGYLDEEIRPGLHLVKAFSNTSPFATPDAAYRTFTKRSETLCKGMSYRIVNSNLGVYDTSLGMTPPPKVTFMAGHILCAGSPVSMEQAKKILVLD